MANDSFKVKKSLNIESGGTPTQSGDVTVSSNKLQYFNGTSSSPVLTEGHTQPITNKTIDATQNTLTNIIDANIAASASVSLSKLQALAASIVVATDSSGVLTSTALNPADIATIAYVDSQTGGAAAPISGDVTGTVSASVVSLVGGSTAANVHSAEVLANAATDLDTASTIVKRDASGNFSAGTITATLTGNVTGNLTGNVTGNVSGTSSNVTGVIDIANGGTNSSAALSNGRVMTSVGGAIVEAAAISPSKALVSDASGIPTSSSVTSTELGYLSGVTSSVQTQISTNATNISTNTTNITAHTSASSGVHGVTGSVVGTTDTQTLTNKTISGVSNTLSNIPNSATTATSSNTNSAIVARDASGNFTAGTITASLTGNVTGNLTGNASGTASNVTGTVAITNGGTGQITKTAAFDALSPNSTAGDFTVYNGTHNVSQPIGTDGQVLVVDSAQTNKLKWTTLQQGAKNYCSFGTFENGQTTGWSLGTIGTLTNGLPTGTPTFGSGASGNLSISTVSSGQLGGLYSLSLASTTATVAGNMLATQAYSIDAEDQAKVLSFKLFYKAVTGASNCNLSGTSSNSFAVAFYDVTNGNFIPGSGNFNFVQGSGVGIAQGTFQTAINTAQIRLVIYFPNATAGAVTLYIDDVYVGPQSLAFGPPMCDDQSYSLTIGGSTTAPTFAGGAITVNKATWSRSGQYAYIHYELKFSANSGGTAGSGTYLFPMPAGLSIDTTNTGALGDDGSNSCGWASLLYNGTKSFLGVPKILNSTNLFLEFADPTSTTPAIFALGSVASSLAVAGTTEISFTARVPIMGWSSNTVMSADCDTRFIGARATTSSQSGTSFNVSYSVISYDTSGSYSAGVFTAPVTGKYSVKASATISAQALSATNFLQLNLLKNGSSYSQLDKIFGSGSVNAWTVCGSDSVILNAGDTITIQVASSVSVTLDGGAVDNYFVVEKQSVNSVVAQSESVNARYYGSTSSVSGSFATVTYSNKDFDSHGLYSGGAYTINRTGKYQINASIIIQGTFTATTSTGLIIYKNGVTVSQGNNYGPGGNGFITVLVSDIISALPGDVITIRAATGATSPSITADNIKNFFSIAGIGN